ncbi:MAG: hypothetical protein ACOYL8_00550 [Patescibacteria group bacterium]
MNNEITKLNLEKFAHDSHSFYKATYHIMEEAEEKRVLQYILTDEINSQYIYSDKCRGGYSTMNFLNETYLTGDQETFLSFFNEILPNIIKYTNCAEWQVKEIHANLFPIIYKFAAIIYKSNNESVFNLDFYYDKETHNFKRKLDEVSMESINFNDANLDGDNKTRYQECVSDFLSYKKDSAKSNKLFYNESLDRLKRVVENTLQNKYKKPDGSSPRIHDKKELSNILFDNNNPDFENLIGYIVKNVHHEEGGTPKNFSEKEYLYLWLELNKILYLLNRYKK